MHVSGVGLQAGWLPTGLHTPRNRVSFINTVHQFRLSEGLCQNHCPGAMTALNLALPVGVLVRL